MNTPRKLLIVGAGGRTGSLLARLAVNEGHIVTTLIHRAKPTEQMPAAHRVVIGDAADPAVMADAVDGQDAVISVVAAPDRKPSTVVSDITKAIIAGMRDAGVRRVVVTSSRNITATRPWLAVAPTKWMFRHVYADLARAEEMVRVSDLDWTIVRATMLSNNPARGRVHTDSEANSTGGDWRLPRGDYARVLLDTALDTTTTHQAFGVNGAT